MHKIHVFLGLILFLAGCVTVEEKVYPNGTADLKYWIDMKEVLDEETVNNTTAFRETLLSLEESCMNSSETNESLEEFAYNFVDEDEKLEPYKVDCGVDTEKGLYYEVYKGVPLEKLNQRLKVEKGILSTTYILTSEEDGAMVVNAYVYDKYIIEMPGEIVNTTGGNIIDNKVVLKGNDLADGYTIISREGFYIEPLYLGIAAIVVVGAVFLLLRR